MPISSEVLKILELPPWKSKPGDYAELEDENDPDGVVSLKRASGEVFAQMPRDVWDAIRALP